MTSKLNSLIQGHTFEEFEYRLVYLRPTPYSDERIVVGLLADAGGRVESRFVSTSAAIEMMAHVFGDAGVEQFQFAAGELRRAIARINYVAQVSVPGDLLIAGETSTAFTRDRSGFLASVLTASSALLRAGSSKVVERLGSADAVVFSQEVINEVSRLNPFLGDRIFHHRLVIEDSEVVELPILGNRVFGAPVSFAARDQKMRAEAYVAKFTWVRKHISQLPRMYVRAPLQTALDVTERLERSIREVCAIAEASGVPVKICHSTEELASAIVHDEAA
jgi:hypothetical protein